MLQVEFSPPGMNVQAWVERIQAYFRGLQRSNERRKRRWLFVSSGISFALVFLFWIMYLNISLPFVPGAATSTLPAAPAQETEGDSLFETLGRGFSVVREKISEGAQSAAEQAQKGASSIRERVFSERQLIFEAPSSSLERPAFESITSTPLQIQE